MTMAAMAFEQHAPLQDASKASQQISNNAER